MNIFKQPRADVKLLRSPRRLAALLAQTKVRNGLLGHVELALLLVVIENTRRRVQVLGIGVE